MKDRKKEVTAVCKRLIQSKSYSGEENIVVDEIKDICMEFGFDEIYVDKYGSIIAKIKGNKPGKKVLLDAHIDTVPVGDIEKWTRNPFGGEEIDGKIYGRGASDMKGALAAMLVAIKNFRDENHGDFSGEVVVAGVVHEECFEGVAARNISESESPDFVVIGEASELNLKIGQRGRAEIIVETFGIPAHSANPEKGINAVYGMSKVIEKLRTIECSHNETLGKGVLELTDIKSSPYPGASVVPDYCRVTYDRRLLVGETRESVLKPIEEAAQELKKENPSLNCKVSYSFGKEKCYTGNIIEGERFFPAWLFDSNEPFITNVYEGLKSVGLAPEITHYSFCTNGSHYAGEKNIKTIGFGPSKENIAHTIDEYIEVSQLEGACIGYEKIIETLLTLKGGMI
ncbi:MAG: YgeY family selenium metabolism-linked hydrolase [Clostridiaceae bacterium]